MAAHSTTAPGFATPEDAEAYDAWFRAKVQAALDDESPIIAHEEVMAEMRALIDDRKRSAVETRPGK